MQPSHLPLSLPARTIVVTPPTSEPVTLADAKAHLRVDQDADDALIGAMLQAARESIETAVRRALMPQTLETSWPGFPRSFGAPWWCSGEPIVLPRAPVASVASVAYTDPDGLDQVLDLSSYRVVPGGTGPTEVAPMPGTAWPATADIPDAVRVRYDAGYPSAAAVPACARAAILLRLGTLYENRESLAVGVTAAELSDTVRWLLSSLDWGGYP